MSEETRAKLSAAKKGKKMTEEHRLKMIASVTGAKKSDDAKKNYSKAFKGTMTALNIETGITTRISAELFRSRRDIYFGLRSKILRMKI